MSGTILFLIALVLSIFLGVKFKINIGMIALTFAFLIGCFYLNLGASAVFAMWPSKLFVTLLFVMCFFAFAVTNGSLDKLAQFVTWKFRKTPALIPFALFFLIFALSAGGMSTYAMFAFMAPIVLSIAQKVNMHRVMVACVVIGGSVSGGMTPISQLGVTHLNTLTNIGYSVEESATILNTMFINNFIGEFGMFLVCYFLFKTYKIKVDESSKPEPFTVTQKKTLWLFGLGITTILIPALLHTFVPTNALYTKLYNSLDITLIALIGIIVCIFLKIGDFKDALAKVPMSSLILVSGISVLISVGVKAGAVEQLSAWAGENISGAAAPFFMVVVSAVFSLFAAATSIVVPTMGTLIPGLVAANMAFTPGYLFSLSNTSAILTGYSPFSSGGSITMSGVFDEKERDMLFKWLLIFPAMSTVFCLILTALGLVIN